jgi:uncharacterized protein YkwD
VKQAMRFILQVLAVWALLAGAAAACAAPQGAAAAAADLLARINETRGARGLGAYRLSGALVQAARAQACDMAVRGYFAHQRAGGPGLGQRVKAAGYRFRAVNENLALTRQLAPGSVLRMWQNSPPHRAALLDPGHCEIGLALAAGGGRIYWVMVVAR